MWLAHVPMCEGNVASRACGRRRASGRWVLFCASTHLNTHRSFGLYFQLPPCQTMHELRVEVSELKYLLQKEQKKAAGDIAELEKKLEAAVGKAAQVGSRHRGMHTGFW